MYMIHDERWHRKCIISYKVIVNMLSRVIGWARDLQFFLLCLHLQDVAILVCAHSKYVKPEI
jgi:hypothetical protein